MSERKEQLCSGNKHTHLKKGGMGERDRKQNQTSHILLAQFSRTCTHCTCNYVN